MDYAEHTIRMPRTAKIRVGQYFIIMPIIFTVIYAVLFLYSIWV